jgi:DNA-binding MarR family transcriptional regulator
MSGKPAGDPAPSGPRPGQDALGLALRRARAGYRRQVDEQLTAAGFGQRRFPDGRVLLMCAASGETTISGIGRGLGITRQGASKIVAGLRDRGYLEVSPSPADGREKILTLTPRALQYLQAIRSAAEVIEAKLRREIGAEALEQFFRTLDVIANGEPALGEGRALEKLRWWDGQGQPPAEDDGQP